MTQLDTILKAIRADTPELTELRRSNAKEQIKAWAKELVDPEFSGFETGSEIEAVCNTINSKINQKIEEA